jgi:uncharacterized protein (TIGR02246 family)
MRKLTIPLLIALLAGHAVAPALAAEVTEQELMAAATELGRRYDANYAARDPEAMAALYESDGVLVSPRGPIVRGREALRAYYVTRFASGARNHTIKILEAHVQGDGGYGLAQFTVTAPGANGEFHEAHGVILAVYQRDAEGWHFRIVEPSVPEATGK